MQRKGSSSTVAVTAEEVRAALPRSRTLTSEEEKALRMRHGAKQENLHQPLPRAAGGNAELADELLVLEMQLLKAFRAQAVGAKAQRTTPLTAVARAPSNESSRAKDKIVRALRKKK
ncbi:MAG: hypothetical protein M3Y59_02370 [Myxococcota bacterium]|nr:hypothetical protein [Myxococcota bacterium]